MTCGTVCFETYLHCNNISGGIVVHFLFIKQIEERVGKDEVKKAVEGGAGVGGFPFVVFAVD